MFTILDWIPVWQLHSHSSICCGMRTRNSVFVLNVKLSTSALPSLSNSNHCVDIRKESYIKHVETFLENKTLKWFGHCLRREHNHICAKSLRLKVLGRRSRGQPKKRWRDNIKEDMKKYRLTEGMTQYRKCWMTKIMAGPALADGQES